MSELEGLVLKNYNGYYYVQVAENVYTCKVKGKMMVPTTLTKQEGESTLPDSDAVRALVGDKQIVKCIFVPGRLLNLVVR